MSVKAASTWQVATKHDGANCVHVWECFTSGGQDLRLEDTISFPASEPIFSYDWMDTGDGGSSLLAIGAGNTLHLYTQITTAVYQPSQVRWEEIHSFRIAVDNDSVPKSFRWTYDGSLIIGCTDRCVRGHGMLACFCEARAGTIGHAEET